ncbi:MAG: hypothetical protein Q8M40_04280 [Legionella sp.]|nr:hypothetical protein [Legionella sp.]
MNHIKIKKLTQKIKLTYKNFKQRWSILKFIFKILVLQKLPFGKKKMTMPEQFSPVFSELEQLLHANFKAPIEHKENQKNQSYLNEFIAHDGSNNSDINLMTESHSDQQEKTTLADQISSLIHGIGLHSNVEEEIQIKLSEILEEELSNYTPRTAFKGYSASVHILSTQAERLEHQIDQLKSCYEIN